ncbi:MAG: DNA-binding protein [Candidatus Abawacabacteria bacterium RBG_16_42_10]|uniref:DNA-binding protein n=1 Tax=Candidatus Abawacabacteria bacterium RBG_16_42_10 TaxID=1817814 RepID=A0A1F4XK08_9BACT|nr:MAG: DNA-binding protein [Candidatus Abawacabacteria bacterium RBG_16_42_10]
MSQKSELVFVPIEIVQNQILVIRGKKVMLDRDLAVLYGVETKVLNQAVKRNRERFPDDFMFQLSVIEANGLRSQFVTSKKGGYTRLPFAFTEQGVAMLSSVLKSKQAIAVNIQIMRTFSKLREMLNSHQELRRKIEDLEKKYDGQFKIIFDVINKFLEQDELPKRTIGFQTD